MSNSTNVRVLLVNLGTPDAPTAGAVRRYLAEFLWDSRVVDMPRVLWWLILHFVVLRIRPRASARLYRSIWGPDGSPLLTNTRKLSESLNARLAGRGVRVDFAMRYGSHGISEVVSRLLEDGMEKLLVVPLYPQYSATTTASVFDAVASALARSTVIPELRMVRDYHDFTPYIDALAETIKPTLPVRTGSDKLLFSFHGIPQRMADNGDIYPQQCETTARLLGQRLGLAKQDWAISFQSRVGREPWLGPYTDQVLREMAGQAGQGVLVCCPGFAVDCLETLQEIAMEARDLFIGNGGSTFNYIPALNHGDAHTQCLEHLVLKHLGCWIASD